MRLKRLFCLLFACAISLSCFSTQAEAIEVTKLEVELASVYATGRFNMDVPVKTVIAANSSFPLEAGETVTIKAVYSPFSASVDFGLIAPDGYFYYLNTTDGSFDETIEIDERGSYTLAVRNNSSTMISVSGYVNY